MGWYKRLTYRKYGNYIKSGIIIGGTILGIILMVLYWNLIGSFGLNPTLEGILQFGPIIIGLWIFTAKMID